MAARGWDQRAKEQRFQHEAQQRGEALVGLAQSLSQLGTVRFEKLRKRGWMTGNVALRGVESA